MKRLLLLLVTACATPAPAAPRHDGDTQPFPSRGAPMPAITVSRWLNSPPLAADALAGKVVLVDFWEYTCVNCIRTLPYVKAWHARYPELMVIGVHAPEFDFGKRLENIERGVRDHGLTYPIALDNEYDTWKAFNNEAWPAKYLFGADGRLRGWWIGEGHYPEIEAAIRQALSEAGATLPAVTEESQAYAADFAARRGVTPETYLGTVRRRDDAFTLEGDWGSLGEYIEHHGTEPGRIVIDVVAGEVNLVMQPGEGGGAAVAVFLDGAVVPKGARGEDVDEDGVARFDRSGMIRLVKGAEKKGHHLVLETRDPGVRAFAFTFGP